MRRVMIVAGNTFRESVRDKVLYVLLLFAATSILGSKALGWISVGQDIKIVRDFCLASMSVFGALISIFIGASLLYKEMDKKTLYTLLAQPLRRHEFVLGKYAGLMALIAVTLAAMAAASAAYLLVLGSAPDVPFLQAVLLTFMKLALVTALAVLLSAATSPILGALIVFCAYVFGHATGVFRDLPPQFDGTFAEGVLEAAYYVIPNLSHFTIQSEAANGVAVSWAYVGWAALYGALYTAALLALACLAFERKDL